MTQRALPTMLWMLGAFGAAMLVSGSSAAQPAPTAPQPGPFAPVSTINGSVPPATVELLQDRSTMMDTTSSDGIRHVVASGVRRVGTRSAIHIHETGGVTCVFTGELTLYLEGQPPAPHSAGSCYYMPPNIPMSAANLGAEDVHLVDIFDVPQGVPTFIPLEPGWADWPEAPAADPDH